MITTLLLTTLLSTAHAVPLQLTQQGRVLDNNGAAVTGIQDLTLRVFDSATNGSVFWSETLTVNFTNGYYAAVLGSDEVNNPLDSSTLALYPLYLEIQLNNNTPMTTRYAINSAPYAQISGTAEVAESVDGGVVNASEVQINTTQVIDGSGNWVGQPITVDWNNIDQNTIPSYITDGDDNTQLSETQVEGYITNGAIGLATGSQVNGSDIVTTATDSDTLAGLSCSIGEVSGWNGSAWTCLSDNTLSESDVENYITNGGINLDGTSTIGGQDFLTTNDETLSGLACLDGEYPKYDAVSTLWVCSADTVGALNCSDGEITSYDAASGMWVCTNIQSLFDADGDGIASWADCDDNDPTALSNANDADCDGTTTSLDCDDNDPSSTIVANDADCDGVLTGDDCDDGNSSLLAQSNDADCDGTTTSLDCDDNDPSSTIVANDADCDDFESSVDCNDNDSAVNPDATEVNGDGIDNDCDGTIDNAVAYTMCGSYYVSDNTYQGNFNANEGFCTDMVGQQAYLVSFGVNLSCSYSAGIWQGNSSSSDSSTNCSLYTINGGTGYGNQGGYGSCGQSRHVVCSTSTSDCHTGNCGNWD